MHAGTNVILERQQRLTEEFVPRADLVLSVMSADRPFAESEVRASSWGRTMGVGRGQLVHQLGSAGM